MSDELTPRPSSYAEVLEHNKNAVFSALAASRITNVTVEFDGYGDSGQIEKALATRNGSSVELPKTRLIVYKVVEHWRLGGPQVQREMQIAAENECLHDAIELVCYDCLGLNHPGWEIDDGSFGTFYFDVGQRTISLEFSQRFTDYDVEEY